ncbi:MAG TPA: HI0074 family nucleotidyltransferase substrate-binding subunit [Geminicoccaceae bacterium]
MASGKPERSLSQFEDALARLREALALDQPPAIRRDVVILRFVLAFETGWKALRQALLAEQIEARYPKEAFREAYRAGWLEEEDVWLSMIVDRNLVAHTYNEAMAETLLGHVPGYLGSLEGLRRFLRERRSA